MAKVLVMVWKVAKIRQIWSHWLGGSKSVGDPIATTRVGWEGGLETTESGLTIDQACDQSYKASRIVGNL